MIAYARPAFVLLVLGTALTGLAYPLAMTGLAQVVMPFAANGSLIERTGMTIGSRLIGQAFLSERYFSPRPSAAGEKGYDGLASSGSNLGPTSKVLAKRIEADVARLRGHGGEPIPADAVMASASGLDPHISPEFAQLQLPRVAAARKRAPAEIQRLLDAHTSGRFLGILGEPRVNVLELNLALDAAFGKDGR